MNAPGWNLSLAGVTGILVILLSGTLMFLMDIIVLDRKSTRLNSSHT